MRLSLSLNDAGDELVEGEVDVVVVNPPAASPVPPPSPIRIDSFRLLSVMNYKIINYSQTRIGSIKDKLI
jgi:hypothetical protein